MLHNLRPNGQLRRFSATVGALVLFSFGGMAVADTNVSPSEAVSALDLREGDESDTCDASIPQVRVTVNGVEAYGILTVEVYNDDARNFLSKEARLRRARVAAEDGAQTVCINVPGAGTYGVASYHDQDGDRKLDRKWNFLPKEPFALSNDPKLKLRKPRFSEAAFEAGDLGADITVNLRGSKPDG